MDKIFVLDTNVILYDPHSLKRFGDDNEIVLPLVVLNEIDNLKNGHSSVSAAARLAVRFLDELREKSDYSLHEGVDLPNGGTLSIGIDKPDVDLWLGETDYKNDNEILKYTKHLEDKKNCDVVLVTQDFNLRVRADSIGLNAQAYKNSRVKNDSIFESHKEIFIPGDQVDSVFSQQSISFEDSDLEENEGVVLKSTENPSHKAIARYKDNHLHRINKKDVTNVFNGISPRSAEQTFAMDLLLDPEIKLVCLSGKAGVGKTLLALAAGLHQCSNMDRYAQMKVARPTINVERDLGFLPGDLDEKLRPWFKPIYDNVAFMFRDSDDPRMRGDKAYEWVQDQVPIDTMSLSHIRGRSISDSFILIDEAQNTSKHEIKTIISRAGEGSKIVCTGDPDQIDNKYVDKYSNGLSVLADHFKGQHLFGHVHLRKGERSELAEMATQML